MSPKWKGKKREVPVGCITPAPWEIHYRVQKKRVTRECRTDNNSLFHPSRIESEQNCDSCDWVRNGELRGKQLGWAWPDPHSWAGGARLRRKHCHLRAKEHYTAIYKTGVKSWVREQCWRKKEIQLSIPGARTKDQDEIFFFVCNISLRVQTKKT